MHFLLAEEVKRVDLYLKSGDESRSSGVNNVPVPFQRRFLTLADEDYEAKFKRFERIPPFIVCK
jgi:hypothetical protein